MALAFQWSGTGRVNKILLMSVDYFGGWEYVMICGGSEERRYDDNKKNQHCIKSAVWKNILWGTFFDVIILYVN